MKSLIVIPARYASTRFPGKPLVDMKGKTMIQRVYEQCLKSKADRVIVATDSSLIFDAVVKFGGTACMTKDCESGTERVYETALDMDYDIIVNVQGDEPFINPDDINMVINGVKKTPTKVMTLVTKLIDDERLDRNVVKCLSKGFHPFMFTRSSVYLPHYPSGIHKHIGIYGFSYDTLETISKLTAKTPNEVADNLEQLRWLDNGINFRINYTGNRSIGIDTQKDMDDALKLI